MDVETFHSVHRNADGEVDGLRLTQNGRQVHATRGSNGLR